MRDFKGSVLLPMIAVISLTYIRLNNSKSLKQKKCVADYKDSLHCRGSSFTLQLVSFSNHWKSQKTKINTFFDHKIAITIIYYETILFYFHDRFL